MKLAIDFHGMCAFANQGARNDALLLPEGGAHKPVLAVPVEQFIIPNSLDPDMVGHNGVEEIAFWDVRGYTLQIGNDTKDPDWRNMNAGLALGLYHQGAKSKSMADQRKVVGNDGAVVELTSGTLEFLAAPIVKLIVTRVVNGTEQPVITSEFPSAVRWSGFSAPTLVLKKLGSKDAHIALNAAFTNPVLSVTNVARMAAPAGLEHLSEYYKLFDIANTDGPLKLKSNEADIKVYDCVPPVALP
jgi:hypothetical protein